MKECAECRNWEKELHEVKEALRKLDSSDARGYEYSGEHEKLEQRREKLVEALESHRSHRAQSQGTD